MPVPPEADPLAHAVATADPFAAAAASELRDAAARAVLDVIAASFTVAADPSARTDRDRLLAWAHAEGEPTDPRSVIGAGTGLAPARAALVGGFQAHLLDLDDTHESVRGHPSAVLVPTLLALAEPTDPVDALLAAYTVGLEVMARLGTVLGPDHYLAGWHPTGSVGVVAAAAAGAHLRRLDPVATGTALSVAASRSGGVRAQFGTPGKPLHAGIAAQSGVEAVQWAMTGLRTAPSAVLGDHGLLAAHGVDPARRSAITADFGRRWALLDPGLWFKRYPFCSAAMSAADAATEIAGRLGPGPGPAGPSGAPVDIREVVVRVRPGADAALIHSAPRTGEQARFSLEAIVALILSGRRPSLENLAPVPLDPEVTVLAARVRREHVPAPTSGGRRDFWAQVEVRRSGDRSLVAEVQRPLGSPENPLPAAALHDKLVEATGDPDRAEAIRVALDPTVGPAPTILQRLTALLPAAPTTPRRKEPRR